MSLKQKIRQSIELLSEVIEKRGAYSQDHLQHAENVIENASERAKKVTETLKEISGLLDEATLKYADFKCPKCDSCNIRVVSWNVLPRETEHKLGFFCEECGSFEPIRLAVLEGGGKEKNKQ